MCYDFEKLVDAQDWAHRASLIFDTDEECQEECERLLKTVTIRERTDTSVCSHEIQVDRSNGQGHYWVAATDMPADIAQEIECEILDGGKDECDDYVASNGLHYRWI